jgi:hypothetical protein
MEWLTITVRATSRKNISTYWLTGVDTTIKSILTTWHTTNNTKGAILSSDYTTGLTESITTVLSLTCTIIAAN